jgi:hypothetical protein
VSKRFTALVRRLGHDDTLYGLRHFMATQLGAVAKAGTVRERMGHGSLAVTSGYLHRVSEADRAAAAYMGALLDKQATPPALTTSARPVSGPPGYPAQVSSSSVTVVARWPITYTTIPSRRTELCGTRAGSRAGRALPARGRLGAARPHRRAPRGRLGGAGRRAGGPVG